MSLEKVTGIRLKGTNFLESTEIELFRNDSNNGLGLLYGKNGAGKSTISRGFSMISGKEEPSIESASLIDENKRDVSLDEEEKKAIFVFNEDFVKNQVELGKDATGLKTIVVMGERIDIQKQLDEAQRIYEETKVAYDNQVTICRRFEDSKEKESPLYWMEQMKKTLKDKDGWAHRDSTIKGSARKTNVTDETYKKFVGRSPKMNEIALRTEFSKKLIELDEAKKGKRLILREVKRNIALVADEKKLQTLLKQKIEKPVLSERENYLLKLLKLYGPEHLKRIEEEVMPLNVSRCPICLQEVSPRHKVDLSICIEKTLGRIARHHVTMLKQLRLCPVEFDFTSYSDLSEPVIVVENALVELNKRIGAWNDYLEKKINNVYTPITGVKVELSQAIEDYENALNELEEARKKYNLECTDVDPIKKTLDDLNGKIAHWEIKPSYDKYLLAQDAEKCGKEALSHCKERLEAAQRKLEQLQQMKEDKKIALKDINNGLKYIFYAEDRLSIELVGNEYVLQSRGKNVIPSRVSVGERNAIALCYFFSSIMKGKSEKEVYSRQYIIVIDDPVSSFDKDNRIGILSYLRKEISRFVNGNKKTKVLIMSHDLQTSYDVEKIFKETMGDGYKDATSKKYQVGELINNNVSTLDLSGRNEYSVLLCNTYQYACGQYDEFDLSVGNAMRRILEAYGTFNYKKGIAQLSTIPEIIVKLDGYSSHFESLMYRLVLHGESHCEDRITTIDDNDFFGFLSIEEKKRTAKEVICFLFLLDSYHVLEHLKKKNDSIDGVKNVIESWLNNIEHNNAVVR